MPLIEGLRKRLRPRGVRIALALALLPLLASSGVPAAVTVLPTVRESSAFVAQREFHDVSRNFEFRGSDNCTYYSGQVTGWPLCGPDGWRGGKRNKDGDYAWCANFAKYVWRESGAKNLSGIDAWAYSFARYGEAHGTLHLPGSGYAPRIGDAVVFDWEAPYIDVSKIRAMKHKAARDIDHVGIVILAENGTLVTIEGNTENKVLRRSYRYDDPTIRGYISPINAESRPRHPYRNIGDMAAVSR